jgi:hypothetical protein
VLFLFAQHLVLLMSPFPAQRASATDTQSNDSLGPLFGHAEKTGGLLLRLGMHAERFACEGRDQRDIKGSVSDVFRQFSMPHGSAVHLHTTVTHKEFRPRHLVPPVGKILKIAKNRLTLRVSGLGGRTTKPRFF